VTSPTGARELERQFGIDVGALLIDAIARSLAGRGPRVAASASAA
jgi:hypothetical protein